MFVVKEFKWICINLNEGLFYSIIGSDNLLHLDNVEIIGDIFEEILEEEDLVIVKKKYNFLKY